MNGRMTVAGMAALMALAGAALAQDGGAPATSEIRRADLPGQAIFQQQCAPCHGTGPGDDGSPMLPGTAALQVKYEGRLPGALELRGDLNAAVLRIFVRRGIGAMPMFRPSELTDGDIEAIAAYLSATARLN